MPAWNSTIPANVRKATNLTPSEKFLFAELSACEGDIGYCRASNKYLTTACGNITDRTLQIWLKHLEEGGYISIKVFKKVRRIYIQHEKHKEEFTPLELTLMRYETRGKIINKICKRFTEKYRYWEFDCGFV